MLKKLLRYSLGLLIAFAIVMGGVSNRDIKATNVTSLPYTIYSGHYTLQNGTSNYNAPILIPKGQTVTIDLNGNVVYATIMNYGTFNLIDSKGNGILIDNTSVNHGSSGAATIQNAGTLNVSATVLSYSYTLPSVLNMHGAKATFNKSSTVATLASTAIHNYGAHLTINDGTFYSMVKNSPAILNHWINGTSINPTITVNGGTIYGMMNGINGSWAGNITINGGYFNNTKVGRQSSALATVGGNYTLNGGYIVDNATPISYMNTYIETGKTDYPYRVAPAVATFLKNGFRGYASVKEAILDTPENATTDIYLLKNSVEENIIIDKGRTIRFRALSAVAPVFTTNIYVEPGARLENASTELKASVGGEFMGAVTIRSGGYFKLMDTGKVTANNSNGIYVEDDGTFEMAGGSIGGSVYSARSAYVGAVYLANTNSNFNMSSGHIESQSNAIFGNGISNITGGTINYSTTFKDRFLSKGQTPNISGGIFRNVLEPNQQAFYDTTGNVSGGAFYTAPIPLSNLAEGYVNSGANPYTIVEGTAIVLKSGESKGTTYSSIIDAFASVTSGQSAEITLLKDIPSASVNVNKGATIILNVNGRSWGSSISNSGTLTIKDTSTILGQLYRGAGGSTIVNNENSSLTIDNSNIKNTVTNAATITNYGNLIVNGGNIHHSNTNYALNSISGKVTVNGGTIASDNGHYTATTSSNMDINGGAIGKSGNQNIALIAKTNGSAIPTLNVNNGTVYGLINGFTNSAGMNVNITGGIIKYDYAPADGSSIAHNFGSGVTNFGVGILNIDGGIIMGVKSGIYATNGNVNLNSGNVDVTGATSAIVVNSSAAVSINGDLKIPSGKRIFLNDKAYLNLKKAPMQNYELNLTNVKIGDKIIDGTLEGNIDASSFVSNEAGDANKFTVSMATSDGGNALFAKGKDLYVGQSVLITIHDNNPTGSLVKKQTVVNDGKLLFGELLPKLNKVIIGDKEHYFNGYFNDSVEVTAASVIPMNVDSINIQGRWIDTDTNPLVVKISDIETPYSVTMIDEMVQQINEATMPITLILYKDIELTKTLVLSNTQPLTLQSNNERFQILRKGFSGSLIANKGSGDVIIQNVVLNGNNETTISGSLIEHDTDARLTIEDNVTLTKNNSANTGDAIHMKKGKLALDANRILIDGDILLTSSKPIEMLSQPKNGSYFNVTLATSAIDVPVIENINGVKSFGYIKLTNSGITLVEKGTQLISASSKGISVMLKGDASDVFYNFGFSSLEEALLHEDKSIDGIYYLTQNFTLDAGSNIPKDIKLIGANRVVSGEYNSIVSIENLGRESVISTSSGNSITISNNDTDLIVEYASKALNNANNEAKEIAKTAYTSKGMSGSEYDKLLALIQVKYNESQNELANATNLENVIDLQVNLSRNLKEYAANSIVSITAVADGEGTVTGTKSVIVDTTVTLNAVPNEGYKFDGWFIQNETARIMQREDVPVSTDLNLNIIAKENTTVVGRFSRVLLPKVYTDQDGILSVDPDGTTVTKVIYQNTGLLIKPYKNWSEFVKNGSYTTLRESFDTVKDIQVETGGNYTVIITYDNGKETYATINVASHPLPIVNVIEGNIHVFDNLSDVSKIIYQNTGDTEKPYNGKWNEFAMNGDYKSKKVNIGEDTVLKVTEGGYYTLIISYGQKEYWTTVYIDEVKVATKPFVTSDFEKIIVNDNRSNASKIIYQFTGNLEKPYNGKWSDFVVNGSYTTLRPLGFVSKEITVSDEGYYTIIITYGLNNEFEYSTTIYVKASPKPSISVNEQFIEIQDNDSFVSKVLYQFTGDVEKPYKNWNDFVSNGEFDVSMGTDPIETHNKGWYTVIVRYGIDNKESYHTVNVTSDLVVPAIKPKPSVTSNGYNLNVLDQGSKISKLSYAYHADAVTDPNIKNWKDFNINSYKTIIGNGKIDASYRISVDNEGWYTVLVVYDSGKEIYTSLNIQEIAGDRSNAMLLIDKSTIEGLTHDGIEIINMQYVLNQHGATVNNKDQFNVLYNAVDAINGKQDGAKIVVNQLGIYSLRLTDKEGKSYYLDANITTISPGALVDTRPLDAKIDVAMNLLATTVKSQDGILDMEGNDFIQGNYVDSDNYMALEFAVYLAQNALSSTKQSSIITATNTLNKSITTFNSVVKVRKPTLARVEGSTVIFTAVDGSTIKKIVYNKQDNHIIESIYSGWSGFSSLPYSKLDKDVTVIENLSDGVYTFLISLNEGEKDTEYYVSLVVAATSDELQISKNAVTKKIAEAEAILASVKMESDPTLIAPEKYVRDALYTSLANSIELTNKVVANETSSQVVISQAVLLDRAMQSVKSSIKEKAESIEHGELLVTVKEAGQVTATREDLKDILIAKGSYSSWGSLSSAGYIKINAVDGVATTSVSSNGIYTLVARYLDGKEEYTKFEVNDLEMPVSILESSVDTGWIELEVSPTVSIEKLAYAYGTYYKMDDDVDYTNYNTLTRSIQAEGNGAHTIYVQINNAGQIEDYFLNIDINSLNKPSIKISDSSLGVYTRGFDVSAIAYAHGVYANWDEMSSTAVYIAKNTKLDIGQFPDGDYTFFVKSANVDQQDWILNVNISANKISFNV